jgi:hypothetical protein
MSCPKCTELGAETVLVAAPYHPNRKRDGLDSPAQGRCVIFWIRLSNVAHEERVSRADANVRGPKDQ